VTFSRFFIERPIAAVVLSGVIVIAGVLSLSGLPLTEYPRVTPPTVIVRTAYPGANPNVIAETVAAPLEQEINGVEGMLYMGSQASSNGSLTVTVTFEPGVDADIAQVQVQNRVSRAASRLPQEVQRIGITTQKASPDVLMVVHLLSPNNRYDALYLSNLATLRVRDELARLNGVGDVFVYGAGDYSLRVWLDPDKVAARSMTASEVVQAIREQNVQVAAGSVGQQPSTGSAFQLSVNATGRLSNPEQFADIVVRVSPDGGVVKIRDIGRVELGANQYSIRSLLDNQPAAAIQILQDPQASALDVSAAVRSTMERLAEGFPDGVEYRIVYDPTIFVRASIRNVLLTVFEATALVILVVLMFLQTWRASFIPVVALPVSLIGTFAIMHAFGFTLNTLSLFGLVLSIGIVVDDAIVVVENVERHLAIGQSARDAALSAMREVTSPILAITAVLCAVFIPTAFLGGLTGQFYRQFALTIAISTVLSAINSLTLSPALAALMLRPHGARPDWLTRALDVMIGPLTRRFNSLFESASTAYVASVSRAVRFAGVIGVVYVGLLLLTVLGFNKVPSGFVPAQDKYYLVGIAQLPNGASLDRTETMVRRMTEIALKQPGVESVVAFPGLSINGFVSMPNAAVLFTMLDPFEARTSPELSANAIAGSLNQQFASIGGGMAAMFPPPPVPGLGTIAGFKLQIEDRGNHGERALFDATQKVLMAAYQSPQLAGVFSNYQVDVPQVFFDLDRERAKHFGVPLDRVFETLQVYLGSLYVNDFNMLGRPYQVTVQADQSFRSDVDAIGQLQIRAANGGMLPLSSLANVRPASGPDPVSRYNAFVSADINGGPAPGVSSGEATAEMSRILDATLPAGFAYEWTDLTYQQMRDGRGAVMVFALAVLLAFLLLAAQYNSWSLPLSVMVAIPTVLLSAIGGLWLTGRDNNIFTQIGLVVLIGLAAKNAILIVEFARQREAQGEDVRTAIIDACRLRLRPVLMTSLAFIMGVVPLATATGAGAEMRQAMGVAVLAGMLGVTLFGLLLTPVAYYVIRRWTLGERRLTTMQIPAGVAHAGRASVLVILATVAMACAPKYVVPATTIPTPAPVVAPGVSNVDFEPEWWRQFNDPVLDGLIASALTANRDLRMAGARYEAARELAGAAALLQLPRGGVAVGGSRQQLAEAEAPGLPDRSFSLVHAGAGVTWEADLFGRLRGQGDAMRAMATAAAMDVRGVRVAIAAQVASAYFELRGAQRDVRWLAELQGTNRKQMDVTRALVNAGRSTRLDLFRVEQVEQELAVAASNASHRIERARNRLATLTAQPRETLALLDEQNAPLRITEAAIGTPATLLQRRPDIAAAESRLGAAAARANVARAELFPRVDITGTVGLVAGSVGRLTEAGAGSWLLAPRIAWNLLDWPRLRREMRAAGAQADAAFAEYELTVLRALEESRTAVDAYAAANRELQANERRAQAAADAANIIFIQYREGLVDSLARTQAERDSIAGALAANGALTAQRLAVVDLYRALGGGW
jgi:gold/copper resistance efflux pump